MSEITQISYVSNDITFDDVGLINVKISNVKTLKNHHFENCINIGKIIIPDSVNTIEPYCFINCINLTEINIPTSIKELSDYCFSVLRTQALPVGTSSLVII
jgi:hypothetical protein